MQDTITLAFCAVLTRGGGGALLPASGALGAVLLAKPARPLRS